MIRKPSTTEGPDRQDYVPMASVESTLRRREPKTDKAAGMVVARPMPMNVMAI